MFFFKNCFLGDIPGGNAYPPETNSENESLDDNDLLEASQDLKDSQIDEMNNNKKIEISSLGLDENDPNDEDILQSDLNDLGISEISSKKSESENETEKEELGIFRNELNKRDKKDYNQKNINNTTKKYKSEIGERNILNISEVSENNQRQTVEKFQEIFSLYKKNYSEITGIKKKSFESNLIYDECHEYYEKDSISPYKPSKSLIKEGKAFKTKKNVGQK